MVADEACVTFTGLNPAAVALVDRLGSAEA